MNHVSLDSLPESVRQFVLSLASNRGETTLESNGEAVAYVVPAESRNGSANENWTEAKNSRRCKLIEKKHRAGLSPQEAVELAHLQDEMLRFRRRIAPLPLEDARRLHQELLAKAAAAQKS